MSHAKPPEIRPHFRRGEMLIVHNMFRREFGLMPGLVDGVSEDDSTRAHLIGDHIAGITSFLHTHHVLEDDNVWPLLLDRCGESVASLVTLMEDQHHQLAELIPQIDAAASAWASNPTDISRRALGEALDRTMPALKEHLTMEEDRVVPLMEQHITAAEWAGFLKSETGAINPAYAPLILGMMMYEGDPESVNSVVATMFTDPAIKKQAVSTFAAHSQQIHGTATPRRSTEL